MPNPDAYTALVGALREAAVLASSQALLSWDQETGMPPRGAPLRAEQLSLLSSLVHARRTDPRIGDWIAACEADPQIRADPVQRANVREMRRDFERAARLPDSLVRELAETSSLALQAWKGAREDDDFAAFAPWLERTLELARAKAECYAAGGDPYDALLDEWEPGMTSAELGRIFGELRARLAPLIAQIADAPPPPDPHRERRSLPVEAQREWCARVAGRIGFDFGAGRLDVSAHPFCQGVGPGDTRLTSRFRPDGFLDALLSTLHEAGHGMYEQGLPKAEHFGEPLAESVSLGIHESQSRLWENMVGRSRPFWEWALPEARRSFGGALDGLDAEELYRASNRVEPGLIRTESDETTYNLHVMLRSDLERALLGGDLAVADLPAAWNDRIRADLGLVVPDDRRGCLQDIHWAMGAIGYFPTYTLGNLYAAQFWATIRRALPEMDTGIVRGDFAPLLGWLRENVHVHGRRFPATELCERVTGSPLSADSLVGYLEAKLRPIYGL